LISLYRYACGASARIAKRDILTSNSDGKTDSYFPPKIDVPITIPRRAQSLAEWKEQLLNYGKLDDDRKVLSSTLYVGTLVVRTLTPSLKMDAVEKAIGLTQHALSPPVGSRASAKTQESRLLDFGPRDMVLPLLELCRGAPDLPVSLSPVPPALGYGQVPSEMSQAPADIIGIAGVEMAVRVTLLVQEFSLLLLTHQYDDAQAICARLQSELATCNGLLRHAQNALHEFNHSKIIGGLGASVHE
jgi:hypothetical protein